MRFQEGKDHCARIPGFNLIMLKTERHFSLMPFFSKNVKQGFINLQKTDSGRLQWGDGSFMTDEEIEKHVKSTSSPLYQVHEGMIREFSNENDTRPFLCQGRILGTW
ncbi:hypothetical protein E2C01_084525 [Portunus trituberculatus]|uniref:Uncharacterized protein n=1 Tax=Portunus trituberculatus TaxID=210409 RepID=A0A5B7IVJ4_PORTR|nr:hypothetical protein [Portunus trituberculatus]